CLDSKPGCPTQPLWSCGIRLASRLAGTFNRIRRDHHGVRSRSWRSKNRRRLFITRSADIHNIASPYQLKQLLQILLAHANAAMRRRLADRMWLVGPVDSVSLLVQSNPAVANRIARPLRNDHALVVVGRV